MPQEDSRKHLAFAMDFIFFVVILTSIKRLLTEADSGVGLKLFLSGLSLAFAILCRKLRLSIGLRFLGPDIKTGVLTPKRERRARSLSKLTGFILYFLGLSHLLSLGQGGEYLSLGFGAIWIRFGFELFLALWCLHAAYGVFRLRPWDIYLSLGISLLQTFLSFGPIYLFYRQNSLSLSSGLLMNYGWSSIDLIMKVILLASVTSLLRHKNPKGAKFR